MSITLSESQEATIREIMRSGNFGSQSEVIGQAIELLHAQYVLNDEDVDRLRSQLAPALQSVAEGRAEPLDMQELRRKAIAKLESEGR